MAKPKHGYCGEGYNSTYGAWQAMITRCYNPQFAQFSDYGGRGITVCERWHIFENFLADMGERPEGMLLDRQRNNEGYSLDNCKWVTRIEQNRNKRNTVFLTVNGVTKPLWQWADEYNINPKAIRNRLERGWTVEEAIKIPLS